ncbi:hypothetical protein A1Q2_02947 [Trichosporon asahii var. asahii CBS 8904]|uniref:Impact N-terminal domain-containing protein n=1 Tax=Trichosporon asahii var. asahii (strain CBS 8904) TaxID=1220162 RepID=K1VT20_TRIAC|nr:hypothetical protein A1Q2_02947 [Trichosporon asahii var. asahii CBS 8904]
MKRASSPSSSTPPQSFKKRARVHTPPRNALSSWLKPGEPAPLLVSSPHLHAVSSTFTSFALSLSPPSNIRTAEALKKHVQNIVRGMDIVSLVGKELLESRDGAFQSDGGLAPGPRKRAREPDHRMWACRTLVLKEGRDGTQGEDDYQLLEAMDDDGERYGGDRVLKVLNEVGAVDVIVVCARWFGGDMLGHAAQALMEKVKLRDLRSALTTLDEAIGELRRDIAILSATDDNAPSATAEKAPAENDGADADGKAEETKETEKMRTPVPQKPDYAAISDPVRLERLIAAKEKTMASLDSKLAVLRAERE